MADETDVQWGNDEANAAIRSYREALEDGYSEDEAREMLNRTVDRARTYLPPDAFVVYLHRIHGEVTL